MAFEFTDTNFGESAMTNDGLAVVDFWAEWCGPCRLVTPIIEELATEFDGKATIGKMNVDTNTQVPMKYGIRSIPTILFFKGGEIVDRHVGTTTKQALKEKINAHLS